MRQHHTHLLVTLGALTALQIILSRFLSISVWNLKLGLSFLPVAAAAILYGPLPAAAVAAVGDLGGAVLFPIGPYFPGFTLTGRCADCCTACASTQGRATAARRRPWRRTSWC